MKKISKKQIGLTLLLAAVFSLALVPAPGRAATTTADGTTDTDGFTVAKESATAGYTIDNVRFLPCVANSARDMCLDPNTKDLFVILLPVTAAPPALPSLLPADDPLAYLRQGLGIGVHQLPRSAAATKTSRVVTPSVTYPTTAQQLSTVQKAVKVEENRTSTLATSSNKLGYTPWGTPNTSSGSTVYTGCIDEKVRTESANAPKVYLGDRLTSPSTSVDYKNNLEYIINLYIKHTIAHEVGHGMQLTPNSTDPHYAEGTGSIMDRVAVVKTYEDNSISWFINTTWLPADVTATKLK
jgi:hypothetical protein